MKVALAVLCMMALYVVLETAFVRAGWLVLYDDFGSKHIDPARWVGSLTGREATESFRHISDGKLCMGLRAYGGTHSDRGLQAGAVRSHISVPDNSITSLQADVKVNKCELSGNPDSSTPTIAAVRILGRFFHDGPPDGSGAGGCVNDVVASIALSRSSFSEEAADVMHAVAFAGKCVEEVVRDSRTFCGKYSVSFTQDLGVVKVGRKVRLYLEWDKANRRFAHRLDKGKMVYHAYKESDTTEPSSSSRRLSVKATVANSTKDPRPFAYVDASFDNVFINKSASPSAASDASPPARQTMRNAGGGQARKGPVLRQFGFARSPGRFTLVPTLQRGNPAVGAPAPWAGRWSVPEGVPTLERGNEGESPASQDLIDGALVLCGGSFHPV